MANTISQATTNATYGNQNGLLDFRAKSKDEAIQKLSQEFESVFLELVLKSMRDTVPKSELVDGGNGEQVFRSMLDREYAKAMAQQNVGGLSAAIYKQLTNANGEAATKAPRVANEGLQAYMRAMPLLDK